MNNNVPLLVFAGSTRTGSFNHQLAHAAGQLGAAAGAQVTHLNLADFDLPLYNGDIEAAGTPRDAIRLKEVLHAHPAWVIASPEYNGSYSGLLKNAIDWASRPVQGNADWAVGNKAFAGKVVGLLAASPGPLGGIRGMLHLAPLLAQLQCWVAPKQFALGQAGTAFDATGQFTNDTQRAAVDGVVQQVLWAASRLQA